MLGPRLRVPGSVTGASLGLLLGALGLTACASREVIAVELGGHAFEYAFLVVYDADGRPARVTSPFGVSEGRVSFGAPPALELTEDPGGLLLVGLDRARLAAAVPGFEAARAAELAVQLAAPPATPSFDPAAGELGVRLAAIPSDALFLGPRATGAGLDLRAWEALDAAAVRGLDALTLRVPVDPEHCRVPDESGAQPYAGVVAPLSALPGEPGPTIRRVARLDAHTLVLLTGGRLTVLEDSGPTVAPEGSVELNAAPVTKEEGLLLAGLAVDPTSPPAGPWRVVVSAARVERHEGHLWDFTVEPGRVRLDRSTPLAERAHSVLFDPDGRLLVATGTGEVWARAPGASELVAHSRLEVYAPDEREVVTLAATGDADRPYLAGSRSRLHVYDARDGRWRHEQLLQDGFAAAEPLEFEALAAGRTPAGALELWAGAQRGYLFRKVAGSAWERLRLVYPPRFAPCSGPVGERGQLLLDEDVRGLVLGAGWVHLAPGLCNATVRVRRSDLCTSLLTHGEPVARSLVELNALAVEPGRLVMAGVLGIVLESRWPPRE